MIASKFFTNIGAITVPEKNIFKDVFHGVTNIFRGPPRVSGHFEH